MTVWPFTAYDPVADSIVRSTRAAVSNYEWEICKLSETLTQLYEGAQIETARAWIDIVIQDPIKKKAWMTLATSVNVVKMLVRKLSTLGGRPIRTDLVDDMGEEDDDNTREWCRVLERYFGARSFDMLMQTCGDTTELHEQGDATTFFCVDEQRFDWDIYTPNTMTVRTSPERVAKGGRHRNPDQYRILIDPASQLDQVWDFSNPNPKAPGRVYKISEDGKESVVEEYDLRDQEGRLIRPFVPFRAAPPTVGYWILNGQRELVEHQYTASRLLTQIAEQCHFASPFAKLYGDEWDTAAGIPFDLSTPIRVPSGRVMGDPALRPDMQFIAPTQVVQTIDTLGKVLKDVITMAAAENGIAPQAVTASNDPASGFAISISETSIATYHAATRTRSVGPITQLCELIRAQWNRAVDNGDVKGKTIDPTLRFRVRIPDYATGITSPQQAAMVRENVKSKLFSPRRGMEMLAPDAPVEELDELEDNYELDPLPTPDVREALSGTGPAMDAKGMTETMGSAQQPLGAVGVGAAKNSVSSATAQEST